MRHLSRAAAVLAAAGLLVASLLPGLLAPVTVDAIGCLNNCSAVTVVLSGAGSGTWRTTNSSYVPNNVINCTLTNGAMSGNCFFKYQNTYPPQNLTIYWLETPAIDNKGCNSTSNTCSVEPQHGSLTFSSNISVSNWSFQADPQDWAHVSISIGGTGTGSVTNSAGGGTCTTATSPCTFVYPSSPSSVTFYEAADPGSYFVGWNGGSCGARPTCDEQGLGNFGMGATFDLVGGPTPSPTVAPTATPKPSSSPTPSSSPGPTQPVPSAGAGHSPGPTPSPGTNGTPTSQPGSTPAGPANADGSPSGPPASGEAGSPAGASAPPGAVASSGDVAAAGPGAPGSSLAPGDPSAVASSASGDGLITAIVMAVGLVVAGLLVAVSILVSVRLRRPPAGGA